LDIIIDGSYNGKTAEIVSCGIVAVDKFGFYIERRCQINHIEASSSFAEWYGLESAFNMIINHDIDISDEDEIRIYTDCQSIVDVMGHRKGVTTTNERLKQYISKIIHLYTRLPYDKQYTFHHIKNNKRQDIVIAMHKRAHNKAQIPKQKKSKPALPESVFLQIRLEPTSKGVRKWRLYENEELLYSGKLRTVLDRYQKDRYNLYVLSQQGRLKADKGTQRILKKYVRGA